MFTYSEPPSLADLPPRPDPPPAPPRPTSYRRACGTVFVRIELDPESLAKFEEFRALTERIEAAVQRFIHLGACPHGPRSPTGT